MRGAYVGLAATAIVLACPANAETPREMLTQASFGDHDRAAALGRVDTAYKGATAALRAMPGDAEAWLMQATALGYHAKLTGSRSEAVAARQQFEELTQRFPRNAEARLALGAWHVGAIHRLGRLMGRAALGAQKPEGLAALDQAVALGGNRAMFPALSALLRLQLDPADPRGRTLAETAVHAAAPTPIDRILQRAAGQVLASLRSGNAGATRKVASQLLPFGTLPGES